MRTHQVDIPVARRGAMGADFERIRRRIEFRQRWRERVRVAARVKVGVCCNHKSNIKKVANSETAAPWRSFGHPTP
jgi:hypothetical protein